MGYTVEKGPLQTIVYKHEHRLFVGPKVRKDLMQKNRKFRALYRNGLVLVFIATHGLAMDWINGFVNNWALSIVVFTFILKLVLFPVTAKSLFLWVMMRKLGPKMKELKDRFGEDDPQKTQEMMKLFKNRKG